MTICSYNECTGCGVCSNGCTHKAITMVHDDYGEIHPAIDEKKCVSCGYCCKICPNNSPVKHNSIKKVIASYRKDEQKREISASGGIAATLGEIITQNGGVYFGACYNDSLEPILSHEEAPEAITKFQGSKYVQCHPGNVYNEIKSYLKEGKTVLFIALPCQIAALHAYLGNSYDRLYTIDLLCHGTSSAEYFKEYLQKVIKKQKLTRVDNVTFRSNIDQCDFRFCLWNQKKLLFRKYAYESVYFSLFLKGISFRESCYICKYKTCNRVADLTIGDFIGLGKKIPYSHDPTRVSMVCVNTKKGEELLNLAENQLNNEERSLEEALVLGRSLKQPFPEHKYHKRFRNLYKKHGFIRAGISVNLSGMIQSYIKRCFQKAKLIILSHLPSQSKT